MSQCLTESSVNRHFPGSHGGKWRGHHTQCALRPAADAARRAPHCDAARVKAPITAQQPAWPQMTSTTGRRAHRYVRAALRHSLTHRRIASLALPRAPARSVPTPSDDSAKQNISHTGYCKIGTSHFNADPHEMFTQVSGARDRASQQSSPPLELLVAVSDLVAVVEREAAQVQMSYAFTTSSPDTPMSGCQSFPLLCSLSEPSSPSSPSLPSDNAFWLPCTVAATLDYIEYQAPGLLHPCVADLLLEAACVLR